MSESGHVLPECGVARFLLVLDGPWATLIVRELTHGPMRFTELRRALPGISPRTLSARLKRFEEFDLVTRTAYAEVPPRVEYELTATGMETALRARSDGRVGGSGTPRFVTLPSVRARKSNPQSAAGLEHRILTGMADTGGVDEGMDQSTVTPECNRDSGLSQPVRVFLTLVA